MSQTTSRTPRCILQRPQTIDDISMSIDDISIEFSQRRPWSRLRKRPYNLGYCRRGRCRCYGRNAC